MKKSVVLITSLVMGACGILGAAQDDAMLTFSTRGPDKYADGTMVLDGECYALVWSKDGVFDGIRADCTPVDANDKVLLVADVAKDGKCPLVLFQLKADTATALAGGKYDVMMLDTRVEKADGTVGVAGKKGLLAALVNGYGAVGEAKSASSGFNQLVENAFAGNQVAANGAATPANVQQPKIKAIAIEGDYVKLTVQNLPGFMSVQGGADLKAPAAMGAAKATDGGAEDVILYAPKPAGNSGFFKVNRK